MTEEKTQTEEDLFEEDMSDALTLDDLSTGYIGNPAVGASISFKVKKVVKLVGTSLLGKKKDGKTFKKNLSNVEFGFEVLTSNGSKYTVSSWEVYGKMKSIFQKLQKIEGVELEITHLCDGMKAENKDVDKYKVASMVDGVFKELGRETKEWIN